MAIPALSWAKMEKPPARISVGPADPAVAALLPPPGAYPDAPAGYNQAEELFLEAPAAFRVPSFPIHHDIRSSSPSRTYGEALRAALSSILSVLPGPFAGLTYFFDPAEILKPRFYRLYRVEDDYILYLLRADLSFRPLEHRLEDRGTNDRTAAYSSTRLYLESDLLPLQSVEAGSGGPASFLPRPLAADTWVGETGRGYFQRGIWTDVELGKFLSKLVLPEGRRHYPFYPVACKYGSICMTVVRSDADYRRRLVADLRALVRFLAPRMEAVQASLKGQPFSEDLPLFRELRGKLPPRLRAIWTGLAVTPYLSSTDQKEYRVET